MWIKERGLESHRSPHYLHELESIILARLLIGQGQLREAIALLQRQLEPAEASGRTTRVIEMLNLQALAFQAGGDTDTATASLERSLYLAEPGGFIRTFVDEGPPMAQLLYEALSRSITPDYTSRLLAAFPLTDSEQTGQSKNQSATDELIEPLSGRETEVLQLIAEGLTNTEIASALFLSLNTVKAHTRNINGKLGVHSRMQAVARARVLDIL